MKIHGETRYKIAQQTLSHAITAGLLITAGVTTLCIMVTPVSILLGTAIALITWPICAFTVTPYLVARWMGVPVDQLINRTALPSQQKM